MSASAYCNDNKCATKIKWCVKSVFSCEQTSIFVFFCAKIEWVCRTVQHQPTSKIIKSYALMLTKENVTALQNSFDGVRCAHFRCRFGKVIFCLLFSYFCCCCRSWTYSLYFYSLVFSLLSSETCSRARFIHARYAIHTFSYNRILYIFSSTAVSSVGCLFLLI